jgi:hypothetical protein
MLRNHECLREEPLKNPIEVTALVVAALSMIFVGWQTYLLRATINTPFQSNLHIRQIDACEQFLLRSARFSDVKAFEEMADYLAVNLKTSGRLKVTSSDGSAEDATPRKSTENSAVDNGFQQSFLNYYDPWISGVDELSNTLHLLRVYSKPLTAQEISALQSGLDLWQKLFEDDLLFDKVWWKKDSIGTENILNILSQTSLEIPQRVDRLNEKCAQIMLHVGDGLL